jgi:hypothetical protein
MLDFDKSEVSLEFGAEQKSPEALNLTLVNEKNMREMKYTDSFDISTFFYFSFGVL